MELMLLDPKQINTKRLFSVKQILLSRGYEVISENDTNKLLLTEVNMSAEIWKITYNVFLDKKLRKELKSFLDRNEPPKSAEVIRLVSSNKFINDTQRFANTFEWFAGELMIRGLLHISGKCSTKTL